MLVHTRNNLEQNVKNAFGLALNVKSQMFFLVHSDYYLKLCLSLLLCQHYSITNTVLETKS